MAVAVAVAAAPSERQLAPPPEGASVVQNSNTFPQQGKWHGRMRHKLRPQTSQRLSSFFFFFFFSSPPHTERVLHRTAQILCGHK